MPRLPLGAFLPTEKKKVDAPQIIFPSDSVSESKAKSFITEIEKNKTDNEIKLAGGVNYVKQLPPIRSQGEDRSTCTAFAVTCVNEFKHYRSSFQKTDLSEQYLFYQTKILENDNDCGSWVKNVIQIVGETGQCRESTWSYNPNPPCVQYSGKPSNADTEASLFKNTFIEVSSSDVGSFKQYISAKSLIAISFKVFNSWYSDQSKIRDGLITMPVPEENPFPQGHSVAIVGYQDDSDTPGGGYFIIRNSWGTEWGAKNYYGSGYGIAPYEYIEKYCMEAYVC